MKYIAFIFFLILCLSAYGIFLYWSTKKIAVNPNFIQRVEENYAEETEIICAELGLPANYFKALIILECGAQKPAPSRFEPKVYGKLKDLKEGRIEKYSNLTQKQLADYDDSGLRILATSWGPLQIMGYHCILLDIPISQLKSQKSLRFGIEWCKKNYGKYLKDKDYRNCFHLHNTGKKYPKLWNVQTHDPDYVERGMAYIEAFEKK